MVLNKTYIFADKIKTIMTNHLKKIPFSPPDLTESEIQEVNDALRSGWITTGPKVKEFEQLIAEYCGSCRAVCLGSATACMEMVLHLLCITADDEVIVPAYTYTATASVTQHIGCKLVLVDTQKDCLEFDYDKLENAITEHTKVIVPVDLCGIICDYDKIFEIVKKKKQLFKPSNELQRRIGRVIVAADCAHAFGATRMGKRAGSIADFSSFSFHAVKNLTTAEGGSLTWNLPFGNDIVDINSDFMPMVSKFENETWNNFLYRLVQLYSLHGQNKDALEKTKLGSWEYDIVGPWYKCNMTDIMAGIGLAQFRRYHQLLDRRHQIIQMYDKGLKGCNVKLLNHHDNNHRSSGHLYLVRCLDLTESTRNEVISRMAERGIACNVHYKPLPMMTAYKALGMNIIDYPNAYDFYHNEITLPLYTRLTDDDVNYIISNFTEILKDYEKK